MKIRTIHPLPVVLAITALSLGACDRNDAGTTHTTSGTVPVDNTKMNQRDQPGGDIPSMTPLDQSNAPADLATVQRIRQALVADDSLSIDGKNVKIIVANGVVTLRGPVTSQEERAQIASKAAALSGGNRIANETDVEQAQPR